MPFSSWRSTYPYRIKLIFERDISYINFPTYSPRSNCLIDSSSLIAISEQSENKEVAWEFVKYSMKHIMQIRGSFVQRTNHMIAEAKSSNKCIFALDTLLFV